MQHAYSRYRTNEMRLCNIIHLTRKHLFSITLKHTEHYVLADRGIAMTTIYLVNIELYKVCKYKKIKEMIK